MFTTIKKQMLLVLLCIPYTFYASNLSELKERYSKTSYPSHFAEYTSNALGNTGIAFGMGWFLYRAWDIDTNRFPAVPYISMLGFSMMSYAGLKKIISFLKESKKESTLSLVTSYMNCATDIACLSLAITALDSELWGEEEPEPKAWLTATCLTVYLAKYALFNRPKKEAIPLDRTVS